MSTTRWNVFWRRVVAYLCDIALLFLVLAPLAFLGMWLFGLRPDRGPQIWCALVVTFSVPAWTYFALGDRRGATFGKRWLGLRVRRCDGRPLSAGAALLRTAVKLVPWEVTHAVGFLWPPGLDAFPLTQGVGLLAANLLALIWLLVAAWSRGARSVHDHVAGTIVMGVP